MQTMVSICSKMGVISTWGYTPGLSINNHRALFRIFCVWGSGSVALGSVLGRALYFSWPRGPHGWTPYPNSKGPNTHLRKTQENLQISGHTTICSQELRKVLVVSEEKERSRMSGQLQLRTKRLPTSPLFQTNHFRQLHVFDV